jgi:site-specific recombinase XerD
MDTRAMRNIIYRVGKRAGLERVNPHAIRHSFATHLLDRGAGLLYVSKLLGHASVSTTAIYLHTSTAALADVVKRCHPRWGKEGKHGKKKGPTRKGN